MAWSVDQANIGQNGTAATGTTQVLTTTNAVAAGGLIILGCKSDGVTVSGVSGGGLTWTKIEEATNGLTVSMVYAMAPSGLASSSSITVTWTSTVTNRMVCGSSYKCAGTITAGSHGNATGTANGWATSSLTAGASDLTAAVAGLWSGQQTSSPTSPAVEDNEYIDVTIDSEVLTEHRTDSGAHTVAGTWTSGAAGWVALGALFTETVSGGASATSPVSFLMLRRIFGFALPVAGQPPVPAAVLLPGSIIALQAVNRSNTT